jgi:phenylacetic acid degradation operon negative regulatory protein
MTRKSRSSSPPIEAAPATAELGDPLARAKGPAHGGSSTQDLLMTLLGDYWFGRETFIPSAALVELLAAFDVSEQAARAALSRASRNGSLLGRRESRHTAYRMPPRAVRLTMRTGRAIMRFAQQTPETTPRWDGTWSVLTYSLATERAEARRRIRRYLRSRGFAPLQDAVWVSPHKRRDEISAVLSAFDVTAFTIFEDAQFVAGHGVDPTELWPLDTIADRYRELIASFEKTVRRLRRGLRSSETALVLRTEAMTAWRQMPGMDPNLPLVLLPDAWPGWRARQLFAEIYDTLAEPAAAHVRAVVANHSSEAADAVRFDTVAAPRGDAPDRGA